MKDMEMPFGKYRGIMISKLPFNYLQWLTGIELMEPLRTAVQNEYDNRLVDQSRNEDAIDYDIVDQIVSAGVRSLARTYHPDAGGGHAEMVAINNAADWLREKARAKISRLEAA